MQRKWPQSRYAGKMTVSYIQVYIHVSYSYIHVSYIQDGQFVTCGILIFLVNICDFET